MKNRYSSISLLIVLVLILTSCIAVSQENKQMEIPNKLTIKCTLSAKTPQKLDEGIFLSFEIQANQNIKLLPWLTPLEGLMADLFEVINNSDHKLDYQGPMIKRRAPSETDYIFMPANETIKNEIDLSLVYSFEKDKKYQISLKERLLNILDKNQQQHFVACTTSNKVMLAVE